jgi:hypothetical protein
VWRSSGSKAVLLVTEAENTCESLETIADGTYEDAAFLVEIAGFDEAEPGTYGVESEDEDDPDVSASAYVIFEGSGSELPLDGSGGTILVDEFELGGLFTGRVNLDSTDPSEGAEGNFSACYCEDMSDFSLPIGDFGTPDDPPPDGPPDDPPPDDPPEPDGGG